MSAIGGGLNRSTQHFILEGKDGVYSDGSEIYPRMKMASLATLEANAPNIARILSVLANKERIRILCRLAKKQEELSIAELTEGVAISHVLTAKRGSLALVSSIKRQANTLQAVDDLANRLCVSPPQRLIPIAPTTV